jgi:hypothetical protein
MLGWRNDARPRRRQNAPNWREDVMKRHRALAACAAWAGVLVVCAASTAEASAPVRRAMSGCVIGAEALRSDDGYLISVRGRGRPINLSRWVGQRVRFQGWLSPGDRYVIDGAPVVLGRCGGRR